MDDEVIILNEDDIIVLEDETLSGNQNIRLIKGEKGDKGEPGKNGISIQGERGTPGRDGRDGNNGKDGIGYPGISGKDGLDGKDGISIENASINLDGELLLYKSTGDTINVGIVRGRDGIHTYSHSGGGAQDPHRLVPTGGLSGQVLGKLSDINNDFNWITNGTGTVSSVSVVTANGISGSVANPTTTPAITLSLGAITPITVNSLTLTSLATGFTIGGGTTSKTLTVPLDATVSGINTGDLSLTGENYLSLTNQVLTVNAVNLSGTNVTGTLAAARFPALTGDGTTIAGNLDLTLATVNSNVGSFGSSTQVGTFTVNAKGLIIEASNVTISGTAPGGSAGGDLSGTYPNPTVTKINGVTLGTTTATLANILIGSGTAWVTNALSGAFTINSTGFATLATVSEIYGGTNQNAYTLGNILYASATNTLSKLAGNITTTKQVLSQTGNGSISAAPAWTNFTLQNIFSSSGFPPQITVSDSTGAFGLKSTRASATANVVEISDSSDTQTFAIRANGTITSDGVYGYAFTLMGNTNVTLPTTGTLATLTGTETFDNKSFTQKLVTFNSGGGAASGGQVGIQVEESAIVAGFMKTTTDRNGWILKAPNRDGSIFLRTPGATATLIIDASLLGADQTVTIPNSTTTMVGTDTTQTLTNKTLTTPVINTSATGPLFIGGTTTTSTLTLRSTSGVGTTNADIIFQTGNNGATEAARFLNSGFFGIGISSPQQLLHVKSAGGNSLQYALQLQNPNGTDGGGTATAILFATETNNAYGKGAIGYERTASFARGIMHFMQNSTADTSNPSLTNSVMRLTNGGSLGIRITPVSVLHVYESTSTTTTANGVTIEQASTGDATMQWLLTGGQRYMAGIDNSDSDRWKLTGSTDLGTSTLITIDSNGNIVPGTAALATNATNGFVYIQSCAGAPSGTPTSYTGRVASIYDTTNNKLYIYNGAWKSVTLT